MTGLGLSGPAALFIGIAIVTCRPDRTSAAAARTMSGVMKLSVPSLSSGPQRPQFLTASKISSNSRSGTGAGNVSSAMLVTASRLLEHELGLAHPLLLASGAQVDQGHDRHHQHGDEHQQAPVHRPAAGERRAVGLPDHHY